MWSYAKWFVQIAVQPRLVAQGALRGLWADFRGDCRGVMADAKSIGQRLFR